MKPTDPTDFTAREQRTLTLFMVGKLIATCGGEGLCRVRNLSVGGLMLETCMPLTLGEQVVVELRGTETLSGAVVWAREGRAGIAFHQPVIVEDLVRTAPRLGSRLLKVCQPRGPRVTVDCPIEVQLDSGRIDARLTDISQGGARVALPLMPQRDERVVLMIPGLPLKLAIVRWVGAEVGFAFAEPLPFALLSEWLMVRAAGEYRDDEAAEFA